MVSSNNKKMISVVPTIIAKKYYTIFSKL